MTIHVVRHGETVEQIAAHYRVSPIHILQDNMLVPSEPLVTGQTIIILFPKFIHIVKEGDTLESIAAQYDSSVINLLQNNTWLTSQTLLYSGMEIVISYMGEKLGKIKMNGYVYPSIEKEVLSAVLPFLTYITLYSYGFTKDGELISIEDKEIIHTARDFGVAPIMSISTLTSEGIFSSELAHEVVNNLKMQEKFINNLLTNLKEKNYYGLEIDFEYILPEDRLPFIEFIRNVTGRLTLEGFLVRVSFAPKTSALQSGILYEAHDYFQIGQKVDQVLPMMNDWGFMYSPAMAVAPLDKVRDVLDYAITDIAPKKIILGFPNYGYDFTYPYIKGTSKAEAIGYTEAVDLAKMNGVAIQYDDTSKAPYYSYKDSDGLDHEVWFSDARSIEVMLQLIPMYGLGGCSYWTVMNYFPQNWIIANALIDIEKTIEN